MSDILPPRPGDEEEKIDYSDVPVRIKIKDDDMEFSFGEAVKLLGDLSSSIEIWWKINGGQ